MKIALTAAATLCLAGIAFAGGSGAATRPTCSLSHPTRVAADRYGSILSTRAAAGDRTFHACPRSGGRPITLGHGRCLSRAGGPGVADLQLAGPFVGYSAGTCGIDTSQARVRVLDLRHRKLVLDVPAVTTLPAPETVESVATLRLRADGAAAWVADAHSLGTGGSRRELWAAGSRHGARRLDSGAGIDPASLRLRRGSVSWRNGSSSHGASLP